ncbi:MAG: hypothetical protein IPH58_05595 [Sphingobacteriales bacterium]|jgi:hypothetical protein|nr:hypothetical protein [Sphingobacteriales bacterium]
MYLGTMTGEVKMGSYRLKGFHSCEIKKSVHQIIQTAVVEIPASALMHNNDKKERINVADKIKEGDAISISFGYDYKNNNEFAGFIRKIDKKIPITLTCEDAMSLFRKVSIKKTYNCSLKEVLDNLADEVNKAKNAGITVDNEVPDIPVPNFIVDNKSALWVLQQLKDWYPMISIRLNGNRLLCRMLYSAKADHKVKYAINGPRCNTVDVGQLEYITEIKSVKVVLEMTKANGKVVKMEYGDSNAEEVVTRQVKKEMSADVLKQIADCEMIKHSYTGFKGSFTTMLTPYIELDTVASIEDPQFGRNGNVYIGTVVTSFSTTGGGRRNVEIDFKLR